MPRRRPAGNSMVSPAAGIVTPSDAVPVCTVELEEGAAKDRPFTEIMTSMLQELHDRPFCAGGRVRVPILPHEFSFFMLSYRFVFESVLNFFEFSCMLKKYIYIYMYVFMCRKTCIVHVYVYSTCIILRGVIHMYL